MTMLQHEPEPQFSVIRGPDAAQHRCPLPRHESRRQDIGKGSIIKCNWCHTQWQCTGLNHGDQRDPIHPPQLIWKVYRTP